MLGPFVFFSGRVRALRKSEVYLEPRKTRCVDNGFIRSTLCHQKPKKQQLQVFYYVHFWHGQERNAQEIKKYIFRTRKADNELKTRERFTIVVSSETHSISKLRDGCYLRDRAK